MAWRKGWESSEVVRTNVYTLLTVFVRVIALAFVLQAFLHAATLVVFAADGGFPDMGFQLLGLALVVLLFGVVWLFADVLVKMALGRPQGATFESDLDADGWRAIAFGAIGIWFAASGVLDIVRNGLQWFLMRRVAYEYRDVDMTVTYLSQIGTAVVEIAIGVALLLGARGLAGAVRRMRGHDRKPEPSELS